MNQKEALKRIEELERRVLELEARPLTQNHYHYHYPQQPAQIPTYPQQPWIVYCGTLQGSAGTIPCGPSC